MFDASQWPLWVVIAAFVAAAVTIGVFGVRLTGVADRLSESTGLGQAVFGAVFLGGVTSLPGITTSVAAAADGRAELAVSNALGGIAAQTVFLSVADAAYLRANLEHAAANVANLMQGALLTTLIALPLLAMAAPPLTIGGVHPISLLIIIGYVFGIRLVGGARTTPMWAPEQTEETADEDGSSPDSKSSGDDEGHGSAARDGGAADEGSGRPDAGEEGDGDASEEDDGEGLKRPSARSWLLFAGLAAIVGGAGWVVASTGGEIATRTGLSDSVVGSFLTAIATSLPELVTAVAAVRRGALTLAVGDVLGGNCFDVLFVSAADIAYREGSIYEAIGANEQYVIALTVLLTGILLLGLLRREKHGIANIGFESFLVIVLYVGSFVLMAFGS
ncbi:MAG TPA: hypothetical protein RMH99_08095 [Sandaracinaceae bacterium LLY-WYZ-13_1]|nr:hypothetical protein [Sandaracinaceae bacterium LLY-WYZ-13_1]